MNAFIICATRSMRHYASLVVSRLAELSGFSEKQESFSGVDLLSAVQFADSEMEVAVNDSIRGKDVILFSSSARNEAGISVSEAKIELYHSIDALKRSQAARIIVFEPYVTCSRSDRTIRRSSVGLWIHIKTMASLGAKHIVTYQLHSDKSKSMVDPTICALDDIPALNLLEQYLCDNYIKNLDKLENEIRTQWAFCSVDAGGEKLARIFANAFGAPLVIAHKQRDVSQPNTVDSIHILSAESIEGKTLWIVDDMIDTGGSVESLIHALIPLQPKEINLIAVHALFSHPASEKILAFYEQGLLRRIIVSDTVWCPQSLKDTIPSLEVVPSIGLSARIVKTIVSNDSMSKVLHPFNAHSYLDNREKNRS